jgi:hypothetical protein
MHKAEDKIDSVADSWFSTPEVDAYPSGFFSTDVGKSEKVEIIMLSFSCHPLSKRTSGLIFIMAVGRI